MFKYTYKMPKGGLNLNLYHDIFNKVTGEKIAEAVAYAKQKVQENTHVGAGPAHIKDNIVEEIINYQGKIKGLLGIQSVDGTGGNPIEYAYNVEFGHEPYYIGKKVVETKILYWVENVLHKSGKEALGVAWAIAKTIGYVGYDAHEMWKRGWEDSEVEVLNILNSIPQGIIEEINKIWS